MLCGKAPVWILAALGWAVVSGSVLPDLVDTDDNRTEIALLNICTVMPSGERRVQETALRFYMPFINNRTDLFPTFRLKIYYQCALDEDKGSASKAFIEGYFKEPNKALILGILFSQQSQVVADVCRLYYVPILSYGNASPLLSDKSIYTTYTRLFMTHAMYNEQIKKILIKYKWRKIGLLITEADQIYPVGISFEAGIAASNITVVYKGLFTNTLRDIFERMKADDIRIFVAFRYSSIEEEPMECLIFQYNLFGPKYQWIISGWHGLPATTPTGDCTVEMKRKAVQNAIIFDTSMADPNFRAPPTNTGLSMNQLFAEYKAEFGEWTSSNNSVARVFDTLTTAALAINDTLQLHEYSSSLDLGNSSFKTSLLQNIRKQNFNGLEGPVQFDKNGDRIGQVVVFQIRDNVAVPVANFDPATNETEWRQSLQFAGEKPPIDSPVVLNERIRVSQSATTVCLVLSGVGIGLAVVSVCVNLWYRKLKLIKLSSPNVNLVIALGCVLGYCSCIAMALNGGGGFTGVSLCWTQTCCLAAGYSCAFGAMFAKTWRVHVIFTNKRLKRVAIKDWHLFAVVAVLLLIDAVLLILWFVLDPMELGVYQLPAVEDPVLGVIYKRWLGFCHSENSGIWNGVLGGIKGLILIFGIFFAWETRKVKVEALNDSKQIGICVYNTLIMAAIGVSLSYVLPNSQATLQFVLVAACIIICSTTTLILVFGSKMIQLAQHGPNRVDDIPNAMNTITVPGAMGRTGNSAN